MDAGALTQELLAVYAIGLALVVVLGRLRVPPVVALILTGLVAGPTGLGLVREPEHLDHLAEIGVDLLLFTVGLEFSVTGAAAEESAAQDDSQSAQYVAEPTSQ